MQPAIEADLGSLLSGLGATPGYVEALVIDEVERSLPAIIARLRIPPPLEKNQTRLMEFRLAGRPGFRRFNAHEREKVIQQLEKQSFLNSLRKAQEILLNGIQAGTNKRAETLSSDHSVRTTVVVESLSQSATVPKGSTEIVTTYGPEITSVPVTQTSSQDLQGQLPFEIPEGVLVRNMSDEDLIEPALDIPDIPIELQESLTDRDIRDLVALIKHGRLIGFLEASAEKLVSKSIARLRVPRIKTYSALNLDTLIARYHVLAATEDYSHEEADELRLLDSLITALENEAQWARINTRRFHLINKKHSIGLEPQDIEELDILEALAEKQMYAAQTLPFAELAMLETYARKLGFH